MDSQSGAALKICIPFEADYGKHLTVPKKTHTTKLDPALQRRIKLAMIVEGSEVFAEFNRTALTEKCRRIEAELLQGNPEEYKRIYGEKPR